MCNEITRNLTKEDNEVAVVWQVLNSLIINVSSDILNKTKFENKKNLSAAFPQHIFENNFEVTTT